MTRPSGDAVTFEPNNLDAIELDFAYWMRTQVRYERSARTVRLINHVPTLIAEVRALRARLGETA